MAPNTHLDNAATDQLKGLSAHGQQRAVPPPSSLPPRPSLMSPLPLPLRTPTPSTFSNLLSPPSLPYSAPSSSHHAFSTLLPVQYYPANHASSVGSTPYGSRAVAMQPPMPTGSMSFAPSPAAFEQSSSSFSTGSMGFAPSSSATAKQPSMSSSCSTGLAPSSFATAKQPSFFAAQMAALQSVRIWTPSQIAPTSISASSAAQGFNATSSSDVQFTNPIRSKAQSPAPATKKPMQQEHITAPEEDPLDALSSESLDSNQLQSEVGGIIENSTISVTRPPCVADTDPRKTIFIVQVRASSGATANVARRLFKRPAEIWEAYIRAYPLPEGTEAVRYRQKDTERLELHAYGYIFSHQWGHKASAELLIRDSDDTLAREILDLTDEQPLHVVVIGTGIDGLSVNNTSWENMHKRWPKATFELCLMVPNNSQYLTKFPQIVSMYDDYFTTIRVQTSDLASAFEMSHFDEVRAANASTPRNKVIMLLFLLTEFVSTEKSNWTRTRHAALHRGLEIATLAKTLGLRKVSRNLGFQLNGGSSRSDDAGEPQKKKRKTNVTPSVSVSIDDSESDYNDDSGDDSDDTEPPIKPTRVMRSDQQRGSHKTT